METIHFIITIIIIWILYNNVYEGFKHTDKERVRDYCNDPRFKYSCKYPYNRVFRCIIADKKGIKEHGIYQKDLFRSYDCRPDDFKTYIDLNIYKKDDHTNVYHPVTPEEPEYMPQGRIEFTAVPK